MSFSRRRFLQSAALGAAAGVVLPSALRAQSNSAALPGSVATDALPRGAVIDWHAHWIGPRSFKLLRERTSGPRFVVDAQGRRFSVPAGESAPAANARPQAAMWYDIPARLAHLDARGVQRQVVASVGASYDGVLPPEEARPLWRAHNDDLAELVRAHPARFLGLASLPTADIPAAAAELERAHRELGLIGATLPLDAFIHRDSARALAPIFEIAQKHRSHLYIHRGSAAPTVPRQTPEVGEINAYFGLPASAEANGPLPSLPGDHALARSTLIVQTHLAAGAITLALTDLLDPYPDVTVQLTMLGGSIAHLIEGIEQRALRAGEPNPRARLRRIYVDTGASGSRPENIALAVRAFGADRVLFGTDFGPWVSVDPFLEGLAASALTQAERSRILIENGRELLAGKNLPA
jgi:predicted TIM-barrel fold metal-dependent hydrolase